MTNVKFRCGQILRGLVGSVRLPLSVFATAIVFSSQPTFAKSPGLMAEWGAIRTNNQGVKNFANKKPAEAYGQFTEALAQLPFSAVIHYNLGTSFLASKEYDKALSEYREAIRLAPGDSRSEKELRFLAHFNSAVALVEQKKIDEALNNYQAALESRPDSVETKTNIELLTTAQQGGGGGGEDKKEDDKKNDKSKDGDEKKTPQKFADPPPKNQPKPFQSEKLSEQDVQRILEELKRQEEQVRAKMNREGAKDAPVEKDW